MTATERLRELLDERGVEWKAHGYENHTWWSNNENVGWHAENRPVIRGLYVKVEAVNTLPYTRAGRRRHAGARDVQGRVR